MQLGRTRDSCYLYLWVAGSNPSGATFSSVITLRKLFTHIYTQANYAFHPFGVDKLAPALAGGQSHFVHLWGWRLIYV